MGIAVPVRTCLTTEVVMNTPWPMLGYVHVLHGEIQAIRDASRCSKPSSAPTLRIPTSHPPATIRSPKASQHITPIEKTEKSVKGSDSKLSVQPRSRNFIPAVELPEIKLEVTHFILHQGRCRHCDKMLKALIPSQPHELPLAVCLGTPQPHNR